MTIDPFVVRRSAVAGAIVVGLVCNAGCGPTGDASAAVPSASSVDSTVSVAGRRIPPATLNRYLARHLGFTSRGGEMRCAYLPLGVSADRLFVSTLCLEIVRDGDSLAVGSGRGGPVALRVAADGDSARIVSHQVPTDGGGHAGSIRRVFPPEIAGRVLAPTPVHDAHAGRLEYFLRGEAAGRLGLRP